MSTLSGRTAPLVCATLVAIAFPLCARAQVQDVPVPPAPAIAVVGSQQAAPPVPAQGEQPAVQPAQPVAAAPRTERTPRTPRVAAAPAVAPSEPRPGPEYVSKGVNIRIDATVSESRGEQVLGKKVVSVTVVDGRNGQVRSTQQVPVRNPSAGQVVTYQNAPFNMDAQAMLREDGRVLVSLTLDYRGGSPSETGHEAVAVDQGIRQTVTVVLQSGTPLVVAQSADAVGDRRVQLEVKATVLK
jgi:hypothetical protein